MNIKRALQLANEEFIDSGIENYFFEVRELLGAVLEKSKEWIMINMEYDIPEEKYDKFLELKKARIQGAPFQYILGEQYFMGFKFLVNEDVLIPRSDTEILVYKIIDMFKNTEKIKILDVCTGSGCIAISLAKLLKDSDVSALDISKDALNVAKRNAESNSADIKFYESDLFNNILDDEFDIIVSNPPYIASDKINALASDVLREPRLALDGGADGLRFYREISRNGRNYLKENGVIAFEIGYDQAELVENILKELRYKDIEVIKDYSGNDRVLVARK